MDRLNGYLKRLLEDSGAQAAVIWTQAESSTAGSVLCTCPAELLPRGTAWPEVPHSPPGLLHRGAAALTSLIPTTLRLELPAAPTAALSVPLTEPGLSLLLVWCAPSVPTELPADRLIVERIADRARLVLAEYRSAEDAHRLRAVVGSLGLGVVSVDRDRGRAEVNPAAATLLGLPAGDVAAAEFATAMRRLESRTRSRSQAAELGQLLLGDPDADIHCNLAFDQPPRHLRVSSHSFRQAMISGRTWLFEDVSEAVQALEAADHARTLLAASADSMLDPQVLLEAVRDPAGQLVDLRYVSANRAACFYLGVSEEDLVGNSALANLPNLEGSGLLARYAQCLADGQPVILTDFSYFNEILDDDRRYDIRATRAGPDLLTLSWADVTDRFHADQRIAASEKRYRMLAENAGDLVIHVRDGRFLWTSPSVAEVLGAPAAYWVGRQVREIIPPERESAFAERLTQLVAGQEVRERGRVVSIDGVAHWVDLHARPLYDDYGQQDGFTAALRLADEEVAAQQEAADARRRQARADAIYRRSIDNAAVGMFLVTPEGRLFEINEAGRRFFGYNAHELRGTRWQDVTAPEYLEQEQNNVNGILQGRIDSYRMVKRFPRADGKRVWGDVSVSGIRDDNGQVEYLVALITDITAQVEADERNRVLAERDPLTGVLNRRSFLDRVDGALGAGGEGSSCAVFFIDLDRFKQVNDVYGHQVGDRFLAAVAQRLVANTREDRGWVGRLGGDEFAVLLAGCPASATSAVARRLQRSVGESLIVDGVRLTPSCSIGCAASDGADLNGEELLARADQDMYAARRARAGGLADKVEELTAALDAGGLTLFFQPIWALGADGPTLDGYEALTRWRHPDLGLVPPQEFIHTAEAGGLIHRLDLWAGTAAVQHLAAHPEMNLAINCSVLSLAVPGMAHQLLEAVASVGRDPRSVIVELTESADIPDNSGVMRSLNDLRRAGIRIALDDFGSGYAGLNNLRTLPIDIVKIDRSLIATLAEASDQADNTEHFLSGIRQLTTAMGTQLLAEGIENDRQLTLVQKLGFDYAQGFLLGPPRAGDLLNRPSG